MDNWKAHLQNFILQSQTSNLKTNSYPKEWMELKMQVSFGMGNPARVPWISFLGPEMATSKGFYPVYLYYKNMHTLILAYGISETEEFGTEWPIEISEKYLTIENYFTEKIPRYGASYVYKAYSVDINNGSIIFSDPKDGQEKLKEDIQSDISKLLTYYKKILEMPEVHSSEITQGLFYMEKELENFLINNWDNTLGDKYELIYEEGDLISQQYKTDIGTIDILAKEKDTGSYVVIELKKNQTSDDTAGQLGRYMGWIKKNKNDVNVKGIIIAGKSDKKLNYALEVIPNTEFFSYKVDFKLDKNYLN